LPPNSHTHILSSFVLHLNSHTRVRWRWHFVSRCFNSIISGQTPRTTRQQIHVEDIDFNFKILHAAWHPQRNILALAATNNLYLYHR